MTHFAFCFTLTWFGISFISVISVVVYFPFPPSWYSLSQSLIPRSTHLLIPSVFVSFYLSLSPSLYHTDRKRGRGGGWRGRRRKTERAVLPPLPRCWHHWFFLSLPLPARHIVSDPTQTHMHMHMHKHTYTPTRARAHARTDSHIIFNQRPPLI